MECTTGTGQGMMVAVVGPDRARFDLIGSDRRSNAFISKHNLIDPRFTPVGLCSNVNKDTLLQSAARHFEGRDEILFVRRVITCMPEEDLSGQEAVSRAVFDRMAAEGAFSVWWGADGLKYGVPRTACDEMAMGRVAVVSTSQSALRVFGRIFSRVRVISITPTPDSGLDTVTIHCNGGPDAAAAPLITALEEAIASRG